MLGGAAIRALSVRYPSPGVRRLPLEFRILGPLEAVDDGRPIQLGGPRQRAVLAILLLSANRVVSIDRLADDLYGEAVPATAVAQVQRQISDLRKLLGAVIETRPPGYLVRVERDGLDLERFERSAGEGAAALERGAYDDAAARLRQALELWRGPALADLAYEPFAAGPVARLEELRLTALEQRVEADLARGLHRPLVGELEALVEQHPTHERFRAQLMLALYRSGRQEDALATYRALRATLVESFGIEPTPALTELEGAVLRQDHALDLLDAPRPPAGRTVLVCAHDDARLGDLADLAAPLADGPDRELLLIELLEAERELAPAADRLARRRAALPVDARAAALVSRAWASDVARLATGHGVDLVLAEAPNALLQDGPLPADVAALLDGSPADVALVVGEARGAPDGGVLVAFAGGEHDWAAVELGAWLAASAGVALRLAAPRGDQGAGGGRLLAGASLAVQRAVGIDAAPLLVEPGPGPLLAAAAGARALLVGLSPEWRRRGLGTVRRSLVAHAPAPVLLVHRGPRPGGLAPAGSATRFTWSLGP